MDITGNRIAPAALEECQNLLCKLPGILGTKMVLGEDGTVQELHVLSSKARTPKQLSRDIQSALIAGFGCAVDHRVISIAQVEMDLPGGVACPRLICSGVTTAMADGHCSALVVLRAEGREYTGESQGSNLPFSRNQMIAAATLKAIHAFMGGEELFTVVDVRQTSVADRQAVLVAVALTGNGEMLLGAVCDQSDLNLAIVKATLDAVNRRLPRLRS